MKNRLVTISVFTAMLLPLQAQTDTLRTFVFTGSQLPASIIPARDSFSTLVKQALPMASMAEWLGRENGVFIKNYGPGNIATITQRGLGAAHTAVLWHGINIQNNTLGTIDFSLIPANAFSASGWQPGNINSLAGVSATGGALVLDPGEVRENQVGIQLDGGSFLNFGQALNLRFAAGRHSIAANGWHRYTKNNFPIPRWQQMGLPEKNRRNAQLQQGGATFDYSYRAGKHIKLLASLWYGNSKRQLPAPVYTAELNARQNDRFIRALAGLEGIYEKHSFSLKQAFMAEDLYYADDGLSQGSYSGFLQWITDAQYHFRIHKYHRLFAGAQYSYQRGFVPAYQAPYIALHNVSTALGYLYTKPGRADIRVFLRPGWFASRWFALVPQLAVTLPFRHGISLHLQTSRIFRAPTLNDRYWVPGGNPAVLPEDGVGGDLQLQWGKGPFSLKAGAFANYLKNRILWIPDGIYWSVTNMDNTLAAGAETRLRYLQSWKKHSLDITANYTYTFTQLLRPSDSLLNRRALIYTPAHLASLSICYRWRFLSLGYTQRYVSRRFITADNNQFLPGYTTADFSVSAEKKWEKLSLSGYVTLQNLMNQYYEVVALRPMPGIQVTIGTNILIHIRK
ncbi:MAG: TonB-dependent receptor plug domain-containing protein [Flavobacteriales bacterium]